MSFSNILERVFDPRPVVTPNPYTQSSYIIIIILIIIIIIMVPQHIPTMTNSHHGGFLSVMIMVGICQWQNPTIDEDDEELQLFNHLTQFNWPQVYFAINRSVWINLGRKYVCSTQLTVLTFHKLSFDISEVIVTEVMCGPRAICLSFRQLPPRKFIFFLQIQISNKLTLLDAGGGGIRPPYHTFVIPRKKLMGKVANFFLLFLNM